MMIVIFLVIGVILSTTASFVFGVPWLMPILGTAVPYPIFLLQVRRQQYKSAFWWMLLWGVLQSIAVIVATAIAPETAAKVILRGQSYTTEMFHWIRTGRRYKVHSIYFYQTIYCTTVFFVFSALPLLVAWHCISHLDAELHEFLCCRTGKG